MTRHSEQFLSMARRHVVPVLGRPDSYLSSIHVTDGGAAAEAALHAPAGVYNVADDEPLTKREATPLPERPGRMISDCRKSCWTKLIGTCRRPGSSSSAAVSGDQDADVGDDERDAIGEPALQPHDAGGVPT